MCASQLHHVVVVGSTCLRVCVKLPPHTKFPNELLLRVNVSVKPEPVVEVDDCIDECNEAHNEEGEF